MKKVLLSLAFTTLLAISAQAQLKVDNVGDVAIGIANSPAPGKLFINGRMFLMRNGNVFSFLPDNAGTEIGTSTDKIDFWYSDITGHHKIYVEKCYEQSDSTTKTNIIPLKNGLNVVRKMKTYSYNTKEINGKAGIKDYGLLAQDVETILPELVDTSKGIKLVNYRAIIPFLVEALQEQQNVIDAQSLKMKELESKIEMPIATPIIEYPIFKEKSLQQNGTTADNLTNAFLFQNAPNPFSEKTEIKYFVPENINNAILYIFDMQGATQKQITLQEKGKNSVITLHGKELKPGMYLYSLVCDGQITDTKKMILTK